MCVLCAGLGCPWRRKGRLTLATVLASPHPSSSSVKLSSLSHWSFYHPSVLMQHRRHAPCIRHRAPSTFPRSRQICVLSSSPLQAGERYGGRVDGEKRWRRKCRRERRGKSSSLTPAQGCCPCSPCVWGTACASAGSAAG